MSSPQLTSTEAAVPAGIVVMADPLYTVEQVGEALGRKPASMYLLLKEEDSDGNLVLPSIKIGAHRRIRKSDLDQYIAAFVPSAPSRPARDSAA